MKLDNFPEEVKKTCIEIWQALEPLIGKTDTQSIFNVACHKLNDVVTKATIKGRFISLPNYYCFELLKGDRCFVLRVLKQTDKKWEEVIDENFYKENKMLPQDTNYREIVVNKVEYHIDKKRDTSSKTLRAVIYFKDGKFEECGYFDGFDKFPSKYSEEHWAFLVEVGNRIKELVELHKNGISKGDPGNEKRQ